MSLKFAKISSFSEFLAFCSCPCLLPRFSCSWPLPNAPQRLPHSAGPCTFLPFQPFLSFFLRVFPHAKKHPKNQALNFHSLPEIFQISNIFHLILGRSGSILGPSRASFSVIFGIPILLCFSGLLLKQIQKYKKTQSAQNTAPVHGFRGSTSWTDRAQLWKDALIFASNFHRKSMKNQSQKWD